MEACPSSSYRGVLAKPSGATGGGSSRSIVFVGLSAFRRATRTWAAFQNAHYTFGPYLSPFYSPELCGDSPHAWFGPKPAWWPGWRRSRRRC